MADEIDESDTTWLLIGVPTGGRDALSLRDLIGESLAADGWDEFSVRVITHDQVVRTKRVLESALGERSEPFIDGVVRVMSDEVGPGGDEAS